MNGSRRTARRAGALYLVSAVMGAVGIIYVPLAFFVPGDAVGTARRILDGEQIYRLAILSDLTSQMLWIFLVVTLYTLLRDVDRGRAVLMLVSAAVIVPTAFVNVVLQIAPLVFLSGADFLSVFSTPQLNALAHGSLALRQSGLVAASAFWGLWLLPFGLLVMRSGMFPRILGVLLIAGGIAYIVSSFASIALPGSRQVVMLAAVPFYAIGELSMIAWLLIKGAEEPRQQG